MQSPFAVAQFFVDLGASVLVPIFVLVLALVARMRTGRAFRSALLVGVGFVGVQLVLNLLFDVLGPALAATTERFEVDLNVIDAGWAASASIAFGSDIALLIVPAAVLLNLALVLGNVTRTINVDIWNFWHFVFAGAAVHAVTGSIWLGLLSAMLLVGVVLFLADLTAPAVQKAANTPGISTPHVFSTVFALPAALLNRGIDALPGIRSAEVDPERVRTRVGALGEPVVLGVAVGGLVALAAYAGVGPWVEWAARVFQVAVTVAAVMVIMPRVVSLIMEGLIPLSEAARDFLRRRTGSRDTLIGVDVAVLTGHPTAVAAGLLLVPITVVLALVLPGNRVLPLGDLPTLPFVIALVVPVVRGNLFRTVLVGTLLMIPTLYIMNATAGLHSQITDASSLTLLGDGPNATSLAGGGSWLPSLFAFVSRSYWVGHAAIAGTLVIAWIGFRRNKEKWYRAAGAYDT